MAKLGWFFAITVLPLLAAPDPGAGDARMKGAFRKPAQHGWIYVRLEGSPTEIGFQHGSLLAPEIEDAFAAVKLSLTHGSKPWTFYRDAAKSMLWPRIEPQYREELEAIAEGLRSRGVKLDVWDLTAMNAWLEFPYYVNSLKSAKPVPIPERCSAFVATGSYTSDGRVVIGHNNWTDYLTGSRWNIVFDIVPRQGHRFLMDGMPGLIHSGDDFGMNAAGILITETTISQFRGYDKKGIPEFVRARKAMQYSASIDDFVRIMKEGNNGGYANDWLVADRKTNEIASLELGLKNVTLQRTTDGYFVGANFPKNPKLTRQETTFDPADKGASGNARHARWEQLIGKHKGKIDVPLSKQFLADHFDTVENREEPSERTLCGHIELSPRGLPGWQAPYGPAGGSQNKITTAAMAERWTFEAALGHACGRDFHAAAFLNQHPEFDWQKTVLRDLPGSGWTTIQGIQ